MKTKTRLLDQLIEPLLPLKETEAPPEGWVRAARQALGMTLEQLAVRMGVSAPRVAELEKAENGGRITMLTLERAAQAMGCRFVYALIPDKPFATILKEKAKERQQEIFDAALRRMKYKGETLQQTAQYKNMTSKLMDELLARPARLWDDPEK